MKIILLSFVILSVVEGAVFTAFHPAQVDVVHGPRGKSNFQSARFNEGNIRIQPASNSFDLKPSNHKTLLTYPGYQVNNVHAQDLYREDFHLHPTINTSIHKQDILKVPTIQERPQKQTGFLQRIPLLKSAGNIVDQTKAFANSAKSLFKLLENNDQANQLINLVFETSDCLENMQDVIELMDETVNLVEANGPELVYLEAIVNSLENEKNVTKQILASAKMLRLLEELIPKLSAISPKLCISSPEDSIKAFRNLGHALIDIKNHRHIETDAISRKLLDSSSKIMTETAKFLVILNKSLEHFRTNCQNHQMKDSAVYDSIGDIMESLAALFDVFGVGLELEEKTKAIRKQATFVKQIARGFSDHDELSNLETTLACDFKSGSYGNLALTLEDLAEIVQSVGIKKLSEEIGIDLGFIGDFST